MCEIVFADDEGEECVAVVVWSNRSLLNNVYFRETVWGCKNLRIAKRNTDIFVKEVIYKEYVLMLECVGCLEDRIVGPGAVSPKI
jgi:hypothetical protein